MWIRVCACVWICVFVCINKRTYTLYYMYLSNTTHSATVADYLVIFVANQFALVEGIMACLWDLFPRFLRWRALVLAIFAAVAFLLGICMTTQVSYIATFGMAVVISTFETGESVTRSASFSITFSPSHFVCSPPLLPSSPSSFFCHFFILHLLDLLVHLSSRLLHLRLSSSFFCTSCMILPYISYFF